MKKAPHKELPRPLLDLPTDEVAKRMHIGRNNPTHDRNAALDRLKWFLGKMTNGTRLRSRVLETTDKDLAWVFPLAAKQHPKIGLNSLLSCGRLVGFTLQGKPSKTFFPIQIWLRPYNHWQESNYPRLPVPGGVTIEEAAQFANYTALHFLTVHFGIMNTPVRFWLGRYKDIPISHWKLTHKFGTAKKAGQIEFGALAAKKQYKRTGPDARSIADALVQTIETEGS